MTDIGIRHSAIWLPITVHLVFPVQMLISFFICSAVMSSPQILLKDTRRERDGTAHTLCARRRRNSPAPKQMNERERAKHGGHGAEFFPERWFRDVR